MRKFYNFRQNNSGGTWHENINVFIEAETENQAVEIAQEHGVYFGGVRAGTDCACCGDRWRDTPVETIADSPEQLTVMSMGHTISLRKLEDGSMRHLGARYTVKVVTESEGVMMFNKDWSTNE